MEVPALKQAACARQYCKSAMDDRLWTGNVNSSLAEMIHVGGAPRTLSSHLARLDYPEALWLSMLLIPFRGSPSLLDCSQSRRCVFYSFLPRLRCDND